MVSPCPWNELKSPGSQGHPQCAPSPSLPLIFTSHSFSTDLCQSELNHLFGNSTDRIGTLSAEFLEFYSSLQNPYQKPPTFPSPNDCSLFKSALHLSIGLLALLPCVRVICIYILTGKIMSLSL